MENRKPKSQKNTSTIKPYQYHLCFNAKKIWIVIKLIICQDVEEIVLMDGFQYFWRNFFPRILKKRAAFQIRTGKQLYKEKVLTAGMTRFNWYKRICNLKQSPFLRLHISDNDEGERLQSCTPPTTCNRLGDNPGV